MNAVASRDSAAAARLGACRMPGPAFRAGALLRVDPLRLATSTTLDSLAAEAAGEERRAREAFAAANEADAESLWARADRASRLAVLWRDARRAAAAAGRRGPIRFCRARVRVRWSGPLVGPTPVDREHVVRALAAADGRWVVYSWLERDRDPTGAPL